MGTQADEFHYSPQMIPEAALFVAADEPLLVFPSATAAERYLEAIDVDDGVYPAAYGPQGEPYAIGTLGGQVVIEALDEPNRPDELRALLLRYLEASGSDANGPASLEELVAQVWQIESRFWQEHDPFGDRFGKQIPSWGCAALMLVCGAAFYLIFR